MTNGDSRTRIQAVILEHTRSQDGAALAQVDLDGDKATLARARMTLTAKLRRWFGRCLLGGGFLVCWLGGRFRGGLRSCFLGGWLGGRFRGGLRSCFLCSGLGGRFRGGLRSCFLCSGLRSGFRCGLLGCWLLRGGGFRLRGRRLRSGFRGSRLRSRFLRRWLRSGFRCSLLRGSRFRCWLRRWFRCFLLCHVVTPPFRH
jgi:hypothetical protein